MTTKLYTSDMLGAPVLNGAIGSLINLLDAVLVNGFGLVTSSGVSVTGSVATMTFGVAHPFSVGTVALIAGATPAGLNGEQRVLTSTPTTITWTTAAAAGAATGTITAAVAGAGWTKPYSGTNLAAYKITDVTGTGCYLKVDDTVTLTSRVTGYESMTAIAAGTGLFPTVAQWAAPGLFWSKSNTTATATPWQIVADSRGFYYFPKNSIAAAEHQANYFGDINSLKSNDPYACVLRGNTASRAGSAAAYTDDLAYSDASQTADGLYMPRAATAVGTAQKNFNVNTMNIGVALVHYSGTVGFAYPSSVDNALMLGQVAVYSAVGVRGFMPGMYLSPQLCTTSFATGDKVEGTGALAGKSVRVIKIGALTGNAVVFVDTISNWR